MRVRNSEGAATEPEKAEKTEKKKLDWGQKQMGYRTGSSIIPRVVKHFQDTDKTAQEESIDMEFVKTFTPGMTYDPFDFSVASARLEKKVKRTRPAVDNFAKHNVDPLKAWKYPELLSNYITTNGQIMPGYVLGHKRKTQKRLSKAIRRARAAGLLSSVHKAPKYLPVDSFA